MSEHKMTYTSAPSKDAHFGPWMGVAVLLVDLDAFFASVEQLDHPAWRGKPVIVGGDWNRHGVVATASYEARSFGVRSAMSSARARQLCPHAHWTSGNFPRYAELSHQVLNILLCETPLVEQVSIDEAFLDVSPGYHGDEHPVDKALRIMQCIDTLGLSCSIGVSTSKSVSKIASERDKPHGLCVVSPGHEQEFLNPLPVGSISGIGPKAQQFLNKLAITTIEDLVNSPYSIYEKLWGKNALIFYKRARGIEYSRVNPDKVRKQVSSEFSVAQDICSWDDLARGIKSMAAQAALRLRKSDHVCDLAILKIKCADLTVHTKSVRLRQPSAYECDFIDQLLEVAVNLYVPHMRIRLVGVSLRFAQDNHVQYSLFDQTTTTEKLKDSSEQQCALRKNEINAVSEQTRQHKLTDTKDSIKEKFGKHALITGCDLFVEGNNTKTPQG